MIFSLAAATLLLPTTLASFERMAGYEPMSQVTDHNAIDLDQKSMEEQLALGTADGFQNAQNIYEQGGHSKAHAVITLDSGLSKSLSKGQPISGTDVDGNAIVTTAYSDTAIGDTVIKIKYATSNIQDTYVGCSVGALPERYQLTSGCFKVSGLITVNNEDTYTYTYDADNENKAGRTIKGFSTSADSEQLTTSASCPGCPYKEFKKFYDYYGSSTYADDYVTAALDGTATSFTTGLGNADFSKYGFDGRREGAKKGSAYMNVYMYALREFEDAFDNCKEVDIDQNYGAAHSWDEGVAFYTGSLEGTTGA
eukprot:scaffold7863_cov244-Chaetoceros_neogracile.AAC.1